MTSEVAILEESILFGFGALSFSVKGPLLSPEGTKEGSVTQDGTAPRPTLAHSQFVLVFWLWLREAKNALTGYLAQGFGIRPGPRSGTSLS